MTAPFILDDSPPTYAPALDPEQLAAVQAPEPRVSVRAGPGAGKTTTLLARIAHVQPARVLAITFTRRAAHEMQARLTAPAAITTFHAWATSFVAQHCDRTRLLPGFTVRDTAERETLILQLGAELRLKWRTVKRLWEEPALRKRYSQLMYESNSVDYDEIETLALGLLRFGLRPDVDEVVVDEFQDTSAIEQEILSFFPRLFVVWDTSQALFRWRGADPDGCLSFVADFAPYTLRSNYRSARSIVDAAARLHLAPPPVEQVATTTSPGSITLAEAVVLPPGADPGTCAVLARTWGALEDLEIDAPTIFGRRTRLFATDLGRRVVALLRCLANRADRLSLQTLACCALPPKLVAGAAPGRVVDHAAAEWKTSNLDLLRMGLGGASIPDLVRAAAEELPTPENLADAVIDALAPGLEAALEADDGGLPEQGDRVLLSTIHGVKGAEWDHVWILGWNDRGEEDERRLFYVALTRARKSVTIVGESRFIREIAP